MEQQQDFRITVDSDDSAVVVTAWGEIDVATAPTLRQALDAVDVAGGGHDRLIIDLSNVEFMDSTALGVLVGALRRTEEAGATFRLVVTHPHVLKVLRVTNLDTLMSVHPDLASARVPDQPAS